MDREWPGRLRVLRRDGRKQGEERREKREESKWPPARFTAFLMVPEGRGGAEKGRALGERTEERKEKGEERELDGALSST